MLQHHDVAACYHACAFPELSDCSANTWRILLLCMLTCAARGAAAGASANTTCTSSVPAAAHMRFAGACTLRAAGTRQHQQLKLEQARHCCCCYCCCCRRLPDDKQYKYNKQIRVDVCYLPCCYSQLALPLVLMLCRCIKHQDNKRQKMPVQAGE
jgi:hypothetical protein